MLRALHSPARGGAPHDYVERVRAPAGRPAEQRLVQIGASVLAWNEKRYDHAPLVVVSSSFCWVGEDLAVACVLSNGELRVNTESGAQFQVPLQASTIEARLPKAVGGGILLAARSDVNRIFYLTHPLDYPIPVLAPGEKVLWSSGQTDEGGFAPMVLTYLNGACSLYQIMPASPDDSLRRSVADLNLSGDFEQTPSATAAAAPLGFVAQWTVAVPAPPRTAFAAHGLEGEPIVCLVFSSSTLFGASLVNGQDRSFTLAGTVDARPVCGCIQTNRVDVVRLTEAGILELRRGSQLLCVLSSQDFAPSSLGVAAASRLVLMHQTQWQRVSCTVGPRSPVVHAFVDASLRSREHLGLALAVDVDVWARELQRDLIHHPDSPLVLAARAASRASVGAASGAKEMDLDWCALVLLLAHVLGEGRGLADPNDAWSELLGSSYHLARTCEYPAGILPMSSSSSIATSSLSSSPLSPAAAPSTVSLLLPSPPPCALTQSILPALLPSLLLPLQLEYEAFKLDVLRHDALPCLAELLCIIGRFCLSPDAFAKLHDYCVRDLGPTRFPVALSDNRARLILGPSAVSNQGPREFQLVDVLRLLADGADESAARLPAPPLVLELLAAVRELRAHGPHALALHLSRCEHVRLDTLPPGVLLHLADALASCRESPPPEWPAEALRLIGRTDLVPRPCTAPKPAPTGLQQVQALGRMRFGRDKRVREVCRLLDASQPSRVQVERKPAMTDHDLFEAQQVRLKQLVDKSVAGCVGRGALCLISLGGDAEDLLVADSVRVPPLCLAGWTGKRVEVRLQQEMSTVWPSFHNGAATGLERSAASARREQLTRTWIMFNKPAQPSDEHAGVLLALGLHGHLKSLTMADMYEHLAPCHDPTTTALLVGLGASKIGSGDAVVSKTLCLHLPALLPRAFAELDVASIVQTAALCGLGLLYRGTGHRLMIEFLLDELGAPPSSDKAVDDREAHALAAGLALGMVGLGLGAKQSGLAGVADLDVEDRLHALMAGGERRPKRGDAMSCARLFEGTMINTDVTGPGATLALGLLFLKSGNKAVAERMAVPDTVFHLDLVRPDHLTLRVWAWSLVMWDRVLPTRDWVRHRVPSCMDDPDSVCCVVAGACLGIGTRFAGTLGLEPRNTLLAELAELEARPRPWSKSLESCLGSVALSLACVMAGSGDLDSLKQLRRLRLQCSAYGAQMAVGLALGLLFLGGGRLSLRRDDEAISSLVCAIAPPYPEHANDNTTHLQAMRHLYVLAVERRLVETIDIDTGQPCYTPLRLRLASSVVPMAPQLCHPDMDSVGADLVAPALLPPLDGLLGVEVASNRFWPSTWTRSLDHPLRVKRRAYQLSLDVDPLGLSGLLKRPQPVSLDRLRSLLADFFPALGAFCAVFKEDAELVYPHLVGDRVDALGLEVELKQDEHRPLDAWQRWFLARVAQQRHVGSKPEHPGVAKYLREGVVVDDDAAVALALLGVPKKATAGGLWEGEALVARALALLG